MRSLKIFMIVFFFSFGLYAQNTNAPEPTAKPKTEKKYIDLDELRAMKANGATQEEINARYNEMIEAIERDFHGAPVQKTAKPEPGLSATGKNTVKPVKAPKAVRA